MLAACLASLAVQSTPHETIVCYNGPAGEGLAEHRKLCRYFGARLMKTGEMGATCCYSSAELAAKTAKGEWLCFPSDDSLYVADFGDIMVRAADFGDWELVYCNVIFDPMSNILRPYERYGLLKTEPKHNSIDKGSFLVKRSWFRGFPSKRIGPTGADGHLIEELLKRGARHGKAPGFLAIHQ